MEYAKKSVGGYSVIKNEEKQYTATHRILTEKEYQDLLSEIRQAKDYAKTCERHQYAAEDQARRDVQWAEKKAQEAIEEHEKQMAEHFAILRKRLKAAEDLNEPLVRMMANRANAKRGLEPKKKRSGYLVLRSEQKPFTFKTGRREYETVDLWYTTIQTPVNIELGQNEAGYLIDKALNEYGKSIGFTASYMPCETLADNLADLVGNSKDNLSAKNYIFDVRYRQNTRRKLWEVTYVHSLPITIPEDMTA